MIYREIRRFVRRGYLAAILAGIVLTIGFSGAAIAFNMVRALNRPQNTGLQNGSFVTIARKTPAGGLARINWNTVEQVRNNLQLPGSSMVAYAPPSHQRLQWHERTVQISIAFTEDGFFSRFTRSLYAGHNLSSGNGSGEGEVIVSEEFGRRFFGAASSALYQNIKIAGQSFVVVGIAPKGFRGLWTATDIWTTPDQWERLTSKFSSNTPNPVSWKVAGIWYLLTAASPNVQPGPALALTAQLNNERNQSFHLQLAPGLTDDPIKDRNEHASSQLGFIVAMALLLSASLNYSILLFARSSLSIEEFRLKRVLGGGSLQLALDAISGPLFVVLASFLVSSVITVLVQHFLSMRAMNPVVSSGLGVYSAISTLAFEFPSACLLGASIALVPALSLLRKSGAPRMGSTTTHSAREKRILNGIVVLEITVCTFVCLFAGSFVREYYLRSKVDLGFDPKNLISYEASIVKGSGTIAIHTSSGSDSPLDAFVRLSMRDAKDQLPGLQSIATASCSPFGPPMNTVDLYRFQTGTEPLKAVSFCTVSQGFFSTIGTRMDEGTGFTEADYQGDVNHVIVNRTLAKALWPQEKSVNQSIRVDMPEVNLSMDVRIVGIVEDTRQEGASSSPQPTIYLPLTGNATIMGFPLYFLARGQQSTDKFSEIVQQQSNNTVQHLGVVRNYPIEEMIRASWQEQSLRLNLALIGAILVGFIAYAGLYGVLIHSVSERQKEFALRLTFGASNWMLQRIAVERILLCCFAAIVLALSLWRACFMILGPQWMSGASWSWASAGLASLLCGAVSVAISLIPARRATQLSPASLLRNE